ncbi:hypothetical protein CPAV1605_963 [seawater metagenome]|uniref:Uncharacterized protein n=1 Tax=seawater metagenome TaxID=1561972 RepID=A0A5E8CIN4_9ZZZZ
MPIQLLHEQKKIYFTVLDINPFLMEEWGWEKKDIKYWLKERLSETYVIESDRLNRKFQPTIGSWCGDIKDFYSKSINKNTIPEYIACPSFFDETREIVEKWKNNPILKPLDVGMLFLLELKPPRYPPDQYNGFIDGLAGSGGRL